MDKFNKVKFLQAQGLMQQSYDYEKLEFQPSLYLKLNSYLTLFIKTTFPLKIFLSTFWERQSIVQLFIGSIYK